MNEFKVPKLVRGVFRGFTKKNILSGHIHTYWFPGQQQDDTDDPSYFAPDTTQFPEQFNLLSHPRIIRIISDSDSSNPPDENAFTFSFILAPRLDGIPLTLGDPRWEPYLSLFIFVTGSTSEDEGTTLSGIPGGQIHIATELDSPTIVGQAIIAAGTPPNGIAASYGLMNGSYQQQTTVSHTDGTSANSWSSAVPSLNLH